MSFLKQFLYFLLLSGVITFTAWIFLNKPVIGIDDANISLNYAKRLANGEGFRFNTGGEKVEGFTSMLWVLICAAFYSISASPELLILVFLLLVNAGTLTIVYRELTWDMREANNQITGILPLLIFSVFLVAVGPSFMTWSVLTLMENGVWNLFFTVAVICTVRLYRRPNITPVGKAALLAAIPSMVLTRPEALAWSILFLLLIFIAAFRNRSGYWLPILALLLFVSSAVGLTLFRLHYFGYPLPNTYYAKVSGNRFYNFVNGLEYAIGFLITYNPVITCLFWALVSGALYQLYFGRGLRRIFHDDKAMEKPALSISLVGLFVVAGIFLVFITGGDHFGGFRFYQGLILLLAWGIPAIVWFWKNRVEKPGRMLFSGVVAIVGISLFANSLFTLKKIPQTHLNYEFYLAADGRNLASLLNRGFPREKPSVGMVAVGGFGLVYEGETVDLMGLNNTLMGHSSGDRMGIKNHAAFNKDVFYQLNPDILLPRPVQDETAAILLNTNLLNTNNFENQALKNIVNDARFVETYHPYMIVADGGRIRLFTFISKQAVARMEKDASISLTKLRTTI